MSEEMVCVVIGVVVAYIVKDPAGLAVGGVAYLLSKVFL